MVDQNHVDAALKRLSKSKSQGTASEASPTLMFEQDSWDKVMARMYGGQQTDK